ncbi:MAG TPA: hypothetical protein VGJ43_08125 [Acidimicrobiales bacterium]
MFITNHALAGAVIGRVVRRPVLAFAAGVASHIAMDMCLHWGDERLGWDGFVEVARVDGTLGLAACAAVLAATPRGARTSVAAAIGGACFVDMDKVGLHFLGRSPFPAAVDRFHRRIQNQRPAGWVIEAGTAAALAAALSPSARYRARGRLPRRSRHADDRRPQHAAGRR